MIESIEGQGAYAGLPALRCGWGCSAGPLRANMESCTGCVKSWKRRHWVASQEKRRKGLRSFSVPREKARGASRALPESR